VNCTNCPSIEITAEIRAIFARLLADSLVQDGFGTAVRGGCVKNRNCHSHDANVAALVKAGLHGERA